MKPVYALWLLSLLAGCSGDKGLPPASDRPDLVLVSIDTLRADHMGVYGYGRDTTPFLDSLAARGTRFEHARSASPWTLPSHTTMLTGQLPLQHHVVESGLRIGEELPLIQQALQGAGYATGGFVSSLFVGERFGFARGFDGFEDFGVHGEKKNLAGTVDAEEVVDAALDFARERGEQPLFLFLHLYDVHYPYEAPSPWDSHFDRPGQKGDARYKKYPYYKKRPLSAEQLAHQVAQYDEELRYVDEQLKRMAQAWRDADRELVLMVTSDHGEEFGERGSWGHAHTLNPEQLHVPLILAGPGVPEGQVTPQVVGLQDIAPTLAQLGGVQWPGHSLLGELPQRDFPSDTSRFDTNRLGLWQEGLRLDWDLNSGQAQLFADPLEQTDLAASQPEQVKRMKARLQEHVGTHWSAEAGVVRSSGAVLVDGELAARPLKVETSARFAVVPIDATVRHGSLGPWAAAGGTLPPEGGPLQYRGSQQAGVSELSDEERLRLEALGYLQEQR